MYFVGLMAVYRDLVVRAIGDQIAEPLRHRDDNRIWITGNGSWQYAGVHYSKPTDTFYAEIRKEYII